MHKSDALRNKGIAKGMGVSKSRTKNMAHHILVKRGNGNCIQAVIHTNGKKARPPCGQR
jgi:hypothetical protein